MTAVRVLLADDQELVRAGLRMMADSAPDLAVVAEAATRQITADEDLAGVKVLILTTFEVDEYVFEALRPEPADSSARDRARTC